MINKEDKQDLTYRWNKIIKKFTIMILIYNQLYFH